MTKNVLFARVGFMKYYMGPQEGDFKPIGGGKYNKENEGYEAYNFFDVNGKVYGFFQPYVSKDKEYYDHQIELGKINPDYRNKESIDNVLVIFFATEPQGGGQFIVGWYKNATVYRYIQSSEDSRREKRDYNLVTETKNAVLLPVENRSHRVGHNLKGVKAGNPGTANVFYLSQNIGQLKDLYEATNEWIAEAIQYVEDYSGSAITNREAALQEEIAALNHSVGQGLQKDPRVRKAVENHAMEAATAHYKQRGYSVEDVSAKGCYDLEIREGAKVRKVEVKGLSGAPNQIILTRNEVSLARKERGLELFILHSINVEVKPSKVIAKGREVKVISPWRIDDQNLTPINYRYVLE